MPTFPFHIISHYDQQFALLESKVADLGRRADAKVATAVRLILAPSAGVEGWPDHAGAILADDLAALEHHVVALLARYHPVAGDLGRAISSLRVASALERICDDAVRLIDAGVARGRRGGGVGPALDHLVGHVHDIGHLAHRLLRDILEAHQGRVGVDGVALTAREDLILVLHDETIEEILAHMAEAREDIEDCAELLLIARGFERIAETAMEMARFILPWRPPAALEVERDRLF